MAGGSLLSGFKLLPPRSRGRPTKTFFPGVGGEVDKISRKGELFCLGHAPGKPSLLRFD